MPQTGRKSELWNGAEFYGCGLSPEWPKLRTRTVILTGEPYHFRSNRLAPKKVSGVVCSLNMSAFSPPWAIPLDAASALQERQDRPRLHPRAAPDERRDRAGQ